MTTDDQQALETRALAGDSAAFGQLIRVFDPDLRRLAWSVLRDPHAIDDVMQVTYEKALRSLTSFDGRSALKTWLHSVCYRVALDHIRYETRRVHDNVDDTELAHTHQ